jgi:parallel beta-helix repeat protein
VNKKAFLAAIILTALLISTVTGLETVEVTKAYFIPLSTNSTSTIYIKGNGTVVPSTAPIDTVDGITYTLTNNIYDSIVIERDNIVLNGASHIIQGNGTAKGVALEGRKNVTISNMTVKQFSYGFYLYSSSNNVLSRNNITANIEGVRLDSSSCNNTLSANFIWANNYTSISIYLSSNYNTISDNNIADRYVVLFSSSYNTILRNNITTNKVSLGLTLSSFSNNNTVSKNNITNNIDGVGIASSYNNTISENNITDNRGHGVNLFYSSNNTLWGNNIKSNHSCGICIDDASENRIFHNNIEYNTQQVLFFDPSISTINFWDNGNSSGNLWSNYKGTDDNQDGIGDSPCIIDSKNQDNYPLMLPWGDTPLISIAAPQNKTYTVSNIQLNFTVNMPTSWIGYSLDQKANVTIWGNTTLLELNQGAHVITVSANNTFGFIGSSNTLYFAVDSISPTIIVLSPQNVTYSTSSLGLNFTINEKVLWAGFSLDHHPNATTIENMTLVMLSYGSHSITVYANDTVGNTGVSDTVYFLIAQLPSPSPSATPSPSVVSSANPNPSPSPLSSATQQPTLEPIPHGIQAENYTLIIIMFGLAATAVTMGLISYFKRYKVSKQP